MLNPLLVYVWQWISLKTLMIPSVTGKGLAQSQNALGADFQLSLQGHNKQLAARQNRVERSINDRYKVRATGEGLVLGGAQG